MEAPSFFPGNVHIFPGELIDERMYLIPAGDEPVVIDPHADDALLPHLEGASLVRIHLPPPTPHQFWCGVSFASRGNGRLLLSKSYLFLNQI